MSLRCAIAGTGFSGALHAHAVAGSRRNRRRRRRHNAESARVAAARLGAERAFAGVR